MSKNLESIISSETRSPEQILADNLRTDARRTAVQAAIQAIESGAGKEKIGVLAETIYEAGKIPATEDHTP